MKFKGLILNTLILSAVILSVSACAPKPVNLIFVPPSEQGQSNLYRGQNFAVQVNDIRSEKHLLKVLRSDDTERHDAGSPVVENLAKSLKQSFENQGLTINDYAGNQIIVDIIQLETIVEQTLAGYEAVLSIELKVNIAHANQTSTIDSKVFTGHSTRSGYLKYDAPLLERDLNKLIATVLEDIYNDGFVQQSINQ